MKKINLKDIKTKHLHIAFIAIGGLCWALSVLSGDSSVETTLPTSAPPSVDTFIPAGHVLVPIQIANAESLTSLVGDVGGVVDLYLATTELQKGGLKVATKLKLLRAPLNPEQYAVLVRDDESSRLLAYTGPFVAVVQNPDAKGTALSQNTKKSIRIEYQN